MARQQNNIWKRIQQAEGKALAGLKHVQFINGRAVNSEDDLCAFMVQWWDQIWPDRKQDLIHIPNEGSGSKKTRRGFKKRSAFVPACRITLFVKTASPSVGSKLSSEIIRLKLRKKNSATAAS